MDNVEKNEFTPNYGVSPGEILEEELQSRGMSQAELSQRAGLTTKAINELIKGKMSITPESALKLERIFRQPAEYWLNLERLYQEASARTAERERQLSNIDWLKMFPITTMAKFEWIEKYTDPVDQLNEILAFFGIASSSQWEIIWNKLDVAYRSSESFEARIESLSAWLRRGELIAEQIECVPFNATKFKDKLNEAKILTRDSDPDSFIPKLTSLCSSCGVAVVFVPELPGTHVSGATRWLNKDKAIIQLSLRHKTDDHLWFTFFHEAGHIIKHSKKAVFIENEDIDNEFEREANIFASNFLIPNKEFKAFVRQKNFSKKNVLDFAEKLSIAPGIIVGRLQHSEWIPHSHLNGLKSRFCWSHE